MAIFIQILIAVFAAAGLVFFIWTLKGVMLTPVRGGNGRIFTVIRIKGAAPDLEHTVSGVLWLAESGVADMDVVIADAGMDDETRKTALLLSGDRRIRLCDIQELGGVVENW